MLTGQGVLSPQVEHKRAIALAGWCFAGGLIDPYSPLLCAPLLALLQALLMQLPFLVVAALPRWCALHHHSGRRSIHWPWCLHPQCCPATVRRCHFAPMKRTVMLRA